MQEELINAHIRGVNDSLGLTRSRVRRLMSDVAWLFRPEGRSWWVLVGILAIAVAAPVFMG